MYCGNFVVFLHTVLCAMYSALPSLLDSDEEVMTTKFEMSKMD